MHGTSDIVCVHVSLECDEMCCIIVRGAVMRVLDTCITPSPSAATAATTSVRSGGGRERGRDRGP